MSQRFDARKANPQKAGGLIVSGLLQRSSLRSPTFVQDQNPQSLSENLPNRDAEAPQISRFRRDFSRVPVQTAAMPVQAKLQVGQPGDRYEQEADRVAAQVMPTTNPAAVSSLAIAPPAIGRIQPGLNEPLQRQPEAADEQKKKLAKETAYKAEQKKQQAEKEKVAAEEKAVKADKDKHEKAKKKKEDDKLQTQAQVGQVPTVTPALENHLSTQQGGGQPLPETTRTLMESRFRHDFSKVRVHHDPQAAQSLQAHAFTLRHNIFFNTVQYQPENPASLRLLAHELTHVVQQGAAPVKPGKATR